VIGLRGNTRRWYWSKFVSFDHILPGPLLLNKRLSGSLKGRTDVEDMMWFLLFFAIYLGPLLRLLFSISIWSSSKKENRFGLVQYARTHSYWVFCKISWNIPSSKLSFRAPQVHGSVCFKQLYGDRLQLLEAVFSPLQLSLNSSENEALNIPQSYT
jgi:hypothetical protein